MAMIVREFEGRNEKEAIDKAIEELGLDRNEIDFEIVESRKAGILFRGGKVKIRVHVSEEGVGAAVSGTGRDLHDEDAKAEAAARERHGQLNSSSEPRHLDEEALEAAVLYGAEGRGARRGGRREERRSDRRGDERRSAPRTPKAPATGEPLEHEQEILAFVQGVLERMGMTAKVTVTGREARRLELDVETDSSGVLIGKQGKTLEAFQFLVNLAASRLGADSTRVVIDTQDYRSRRERSLERLANQAAERVRRSRDSTLLEPLNPFERRIVHTTLAKRGDVETISEGDGLYKRIRVTWRGAGGRDSGRGGRESGRGRRRGGQVREEVRDREGVPEQEPAGEPDDGPEPGEQSSSEE